MNKRYLLKTLILLVAFSSFLLLAEEVKIPQVQKIKKPKVQPKPGVQLIIEGTVTLSSDRSTHLPGVEIILYEHVRSGLRRVKNTKTNSRGFYQLKVGSSFMNKSVKLVPTFESYEGEQHFTPDEISFTITNRISRHYFQYSGPLPDLRGETATATAGTPGIKITYRATVTNNGIVDAGPFKVKLIVERRIINTSPPFGESSSEGEVTLQFPGLRKNNTETEEKVINLTVPTIITVKRMIVDSDDTVVEINEGNNETIIR